MPSQVELKSSEEEHFLECPECQGYGVKGIGFNCNNCGGLGTGVFHNGYFFYYKPIVSLTVIELRRFKFLVNLIVNLFAFGIGIIGFLCLFLWIYETSRYTVRIEYFAFWNQKSPLLSFFWLSLLADLFVIYRISQDTIRSQAAKVFKYSKINDSQKPLNNWRDLKVAGSKNVIDVSRSFSIETSNIIDEAYILCNNFDHPRVEPIHLFFASLESKGVAALFSRLEVNAQDLASRIKHILEKKKKKNVSPVLSPELKQVLIESYIEASSLNMRKVSPKNLIASCIKQDELLREVLKEIDVDEKKIFNMVIWFAVNEKQVSDYKKFRSEARFKPSGSMDRAYTAVATPMLNRYGYDLTLAAKWQHLEYTVARDKELGDIWERLESGDNGILLVGSHGVGKRSIINAVAQRMVEENVPKFLLDKRLVELDIARLVSGADASEAEGRLIKVVDELNHAGNIAIFISNIESIIGITSGSESSMDLAEVFVSVVERKLLYVFGTVSLEDYHKYIEGSAIDKNFSTLMIEEPKDNKAIQIIASKVSLMEEKFKVYFSYRAIEKAVMYSEKYMHDSYLPQKAIKLLEIAAAKVSKRKESNPLISGEVIAEIVSDQVNIPITKISQSESEELLHLEEKIHESMVGQEEAVKKVSASLRRARAQLREGDRPIAGFLFLGPTGVGKTELAKTVSREYFGDEKYMIRVDMSEYQHPDSVKKMIGDASGIKGYLTEKVRKSPFSLILLDEIEKAHKDILNLFLQVLDDGRLSDGQGHVVDFTNSILIATSNLGAKLIQDEIYKGSSVEDIRAILLNDYLNNVMRPELINRFDAVIVFEPLSIESVVEIARILIKNIEQMLANKGMELLVEDRGLRKLAKQGFDPKYGARPLKRVIQDKVENSIANYILSGELKRRDTVIIDEDANVVIRKAKEL